MLAKILRNNSGLFGNSKTSPALDFFGVQRAKLECYNCADKTSVSPRAIFCKRLLIADNS